MLPTTAGEVAAAERAEERAEEDAAERASALAEAVDTLVGLMQRAQAWIRAEGFPLVFGDDFIAGPWRSAMVDVLGKHATPKLIEGIRDTKSSMGYVVAVGLPVQTVVAGAAIGIRKLRQRKRGAERAPVVGEERGPDDEREEEGGAERAPVGRGFI